MNERPERQGGRGPGGGRPPGGPGGQGGPPRGPGGRPGGPGGDGQRRPPADAIRPLNDADLDAIVVKGDAKAIDSQAFQIARGLAGQGAEGKSITSSQLRNFFGEVRRIQLGWSSRDAASAHESSRALVLLKPRLAYAAGKAGGAGGRGLGILRDILAPSIDLVGEDRERFGHFVEFFEAIVAYYYASPSGWR